MSVLLVACRTQTLEERIRELVREIAPDPDGVGPQRAPELRYRYDRLNRLIASAQVIGGDDGDSWLPENEGYWVAGGDDLVVRYDYDARGRLTDVTDPAVLAITRAARTTFEDLT